MNLKTQLPLAFGAVLLLMMSASLYGIARLEGAIGRYGQEVEARHADERAVEQILVDFKTQVQEWKDTLLRGSDPVKFDRYWAAFQQREAAVDEQTRQLLAALPAGQSRDEVERFQAAHATMGRGYREGLAAFRAARFDPVAGDRAVVGIDREPARLLAEAGQRIAAVSAAVSASAAREARQAFIGTLLLMGVAGALGLGLALWFSRHLTRPIVRAATLARRIADGDLSTELQAGGGDEIGALLDALSTMQGSLVRLVRAVRGNAESVALASAEIAQGSGDLSGRTETQAAALQQAAASMGHFGAAVQQNAASAAEADRLARGAHTVAGRGGDVVGEVVATMQEINDASRRVADIIAVIDGIAFQTNILALNAAVESARAGEQGRGFAVVAGEVRGLAHRSAAAAQEIKALIAASVERVDRGSALVAQAGSTMRDIVGSIARVSEIIGEISVASTQQSESVVQIGASISHMDDATQRNAALVEETAAAAESLREQARDLVGAVQVFTLPAGAARP